MHLKIVNEGLTGKTGQVWIDGVRQTTVTDVKVHLSATDVTRATLTYLVGHLEIDSPADIPTITVTPPPPPPERNGPSIDYERWRWPES